MKTGLPFVGIKLAQTIDGRIADVSGKSKWITSKAARTEVHRLRSHYDAVLVGAHTVFYDNPTLTVRFVKARNPIRVVVDGHLSLSTTHTIFQTSVAQTWVLTSVRAVKRNIRKVEKLVSQGVRVLPISTNVNIDANTILRTLAAEGISSVLLEGGARTINAFITGFHVDTLFLFIAPKILGGGLNGFVLNPPKLLHNPIGITIKKVSLFGKDILLEANYKHT